MFDPLLPNNNLKKLPREVNFRDSDILIGLHQANTELLELKGITDTLPNPQILIDFLSFREGIGSNAIEQINTTLFDVLLSQQDSISQRSKENKETINYKESILFGYEQIKKTGGITINDLVYINTLLIDNDAGIISSPDKKIEKVISLKREILYTPPQGIDLIKELCYNLEEYINHYDEDKEIDPLLKLPIIHYQFEAIHPFGDGNGRVGRIIIILYLVLYNKLSYPLLFLSEYINEHKDEYYRLLHNIDISGINAVKEFMLYMFHAIRVQSTVTQILIQKIGILYQKTKFSLKENINLKNVYSKELMDYLFKDPIYTRRRYAQYIKVNERTAATHLDLLSAAGICIKKKYKTSVYYINQSYLDLMIIQ